MAIRNQSGFSPRAHVLSAALSAIAICSASTADAQSQSLFGNRGPASQIGSNLRGSAVGRGTTFGTTAQQSGLSGQPLSGMSGNIAPTGTQQGANAGIVGRANPGRFIGNQRAAQGATGANSAALSFSNRGNQSSQRTGMSFGDDRVSGNRATSTRIIRPRQKIAFDFPDQNREMIGSKLNSRFQQLSTQQRTLSQVKVSVDESGTATLIGSVENSEVARLAEMMARLEPGVRVVRNELTVNGSSEE